MTKLCYLLVLAFPLFSCTSKNRVSSPDKTIQISVGEEGGRIFYTATKEGRTLLDKSFLGFVLADGALGEGVRIKHVDHTTFSGKWDQTWGEEIVVDNTYAQLTVKVEEIDGLKRAFDVVFRVFNDGFGFRYEFPEQANLKSFVIMDEITEFNFTHNHKCWSIPYGAEYYEALYETNLINELDTVCVPLTIETDKGLYLAVHEANLTDYAAMNLVPEKGTSTLKVYLTPWSTGEKVFAMAPSVTPWRTMIIAGSPGDLLLSRLMLNLNEPSKIEDTSWIRPGRYIGMVCT